MSQNIDPSAGEPSGSPAPPPPPPSAGSGAPPLPPPGSPENPTGSAPPPPPPPPPRLDLGQELRTFRRSRNDRVIAGVCGGIAARLGIDPVLVRVLFVASIFVGGVGVLVYALAWLLMPQENGDASLIEEALGRRSTGGRGSALALSILLVLVAVGVAGSFLGDWGGPLLVILGITAVVMLLRRGSTPEPGPTAESPNVPTAAGSMPTPQTDATTAPIGTTTTTQPLPGGPPTPSEWQTPPAPPMPRERSRLFPLVMSALLVVIGTLALADAAGADIAGGTYIASALATVGLGLLVGAWWGRSRGLIAVGLILALALPFAAAHDRFSQFEGPRGRVVIDATTIEQGTGTYDHGAGEVIYDLSKLNFTGRNEELNIDMGAGSVQVTLPPEVDVDIDANIGVGELRILDRKPNGGFGVETHVVDNGTDGPGGGQLRLNVDSGFGEVVVSRAAA